MSEITDEVLKVLNVFEESVKVNFLPEEIDDNVEEIQKIMSYIEGQNTKLEDENQN